MDTTQTLIENYLAYCSSQKRLDEKTLKAYRIDLRQFSEQTPPVEFPALSSAALEAYIAALHRQYKPKTVKRKIASVKAFFHYLEYKDILIRNPFNKLQIRFREPAILPKTIPLPVVETFLTTIYRQRRTATTLYQKRNAAVQQLSPTAYFTSAFSAAIFSTSLIFFPTVLIQFVSYASFTYSISLPCIVGLASHTFFSNGFHSFFLANI